MPYKHDYDKALTRLTIIVQKLYEGEELSIKDLATEFNVSTKTIQRDLNGRLASFPIERIGNKFKFADGFHLERNNDLRDEFVLEILGKISDNIGAGFATRAENMLSKLKNSHANPFYLNILLEKQPKKVAELKHIDEAITSNLAITFNYYEETIKAEPIKIINFDGFWYLLAKDVKNKLYKNYLVKHISKIELTNIKFKLDKDIEDKIQNAINEHFDANAKAFEVRLKIMPQAVEKISSKPISKSQQIINFNDDDSIEISIRATNLYEIIPTIKYYMPHIMPIYPIELKDILKNEIAEFAKLLN